MPLLAIKVCGKCFFINLNPFVWLQIAFLVLIFFAKIPVAYRHFCIVMGLIIVEIIVMNRLTVHSVSLVYKKLLQIKLSICIYRS